MFGINSSSNQNKLETSGWDGIMIALGLAWGWDMCLVILVSSTPISVLYEYVPVLRVLLCVEYIHRMDMKFIS